MQRSAQTAKGKVQQAVPPAAIGTGWPSLQCKALHLGRRHIGNVEPGLQRAAAAVVLEYFTDRGAGRQRFIMAARSASQAAALSFSNAELFRRGVP
jgi:hypothetical protein